MAFKSNSPRGWNDLAEDLLLLDSTLRGFQNVQNDVQQTYFLRCLRLSEDTSALLGRWASQAGLPSYVARLDPRGWDAFETAERNIASMRQQIMFLSMQVQNDRLNAIDGKLDALLASDTMHREISTKLSELQASLNEDPWRTRRRWALSEESPPDPSRSRPLLRRRRSSDDLRRSISPIPSEVASEPTVSASGRLKPVAAFSRPYSEREPTNSKYYTRDFPLRRASTRSSFASGSGDNNRLLLSVEDTIQRLILPELYAIKGEKKSGESRYNTNVEFKANVLNSDTPTLARAVQDSKASINVVSSRFLELHDLTGDDVEVLKPRPQPGRYGELVTADKAIELRWAPAGSTKWMKTEFFVTENKTDYDIMLSRDFVDLRGMFDDTNVEVYAFKLPGRSRAQRDANTLRTERSRRRNEEEDEELRERDRRERSRERLSRRVAARLAQTGSEPASSLAGTASQLTPSTTATGATSGQATPVSAIHQGPELNPVPNAAVAQPQPGDERADVPAPATI